MKRIFIFIVLFIAIASSVWLFFIKGKQPDANPVATVFQSFFPITDTGNDFSDGVIADNPLLGGTITAERFTQVSPRPVAGYTIFALNNTITTPNPDPKLKPIVTTVLDHYIRYVSRTNGYVYEIKNTQPAIQITNILIPNIYEASFVNNTSTALLRFLKNDNQTIATYSVPIPQLNPDGKRTQKMGIYLADNSTSIAVSPDSKQIARLTTETSGAVISTLAPNNTGKKDIIRTPFKEWLVSWPTQSTIYVQTKAASIVNGYLYRIDSAAGRLRRVLGDVPGLTTSISPTGEYILYSQSTQNSFITKLFNTKSGTTTSLSLALLPEKCVWYKNNDLICAGSNTVEDAVYPDSWYAGLTHFNDQIYRINTATNTYTVLYSENERAFDITNLQLDEGQNLLYFIEKTTGLLWKVSL